MKKIIAISILLAVPALAQIPVAAGQINTVSGTGRTLVTTTGPQTNGNTVVIDASGNHVASGSSGSATGCSGSGICIGGSSSASTTAPAVDVQFTQAGTGATPVSIDANLKATPVNVKQFGAVCDGTTDDHVAIQAAIAALPAIGGSVLIPDGASCSIGTVGITIPAGTLGDRIASSSSFSGKLIYSGSGSALTVGGTGADTYYASVDNVYFELTNAGQNAKAINAIRTQHFTVTDAHFFSNYTTLVSGQIAIYLDGHNPNFSAFTFLSNNHMMGTWKKGIDLVGIVNSTTILGGSILHVNPAVSGTVGIHVESGTSTAVYNTDIEWFDHGLQIDDSYNGPLAGRTESNNVGLYISSGAGFTRVVGAEHADGVTDLSTTTTTVASRVVGNNLSLFNEGASFGSIIKFPALGGSQGIGWYSSGSLVSYILDFGTLQMNAATGHGLALAYNGTQNLLLDATGLSFPQITASKILKTDGSHILAPAVSSDVVGLFSGCSGTLALSADGACHASSGTTDPASTFYETDDFISGNTSAVGTLGWVVVGATPTFPAAVAGHPGLINMATGAVSGTVVAIVPANAAANAFIPTDTFDLTWIVRLNTNDSNTLVRVGINAQSSSAPNPPTDAIYFEKLAADTDWFTVTRASSTQTRTDSTIAVGTGFIRFRVRRVNVSTIGFTINGGTETTVTTNIPTSGAVPWVEIVNSTTASKTIDLDYMGLTITGLSR